MAALDNEVAIFLIERLLAGQVQKLFQSRSVRIWEMFAHKEELIWSDTCPYERLD